MDQHLHLIFVYCDKHDQGAVAIITHEEWLAITFATNNNTNKEIYYEQIFKYVITMCGSELPECKYLWRCCGELEYNPLGELLIGQESVQTKFDEECGGWEFKYFKKELFTSKEHIEDYILPQVVREYLYQCAQVPVSH